MTDTKQPEALRLAARLRSVCAIVRSKSYPLSDLIPLMQEAADTLERTGSENAALQQGYDAARLEIEARNNQLVKEAARTAEEKLRADRMTEQHRMQCQMREGLEREIEALREREGMHRMSTLDGICLESTMSYALHQKITGTWDDKHYPELPKSAGLVTTQEPITVGGWVKHLEEPGFTEDQLRAYADATCAMRAQADSQPVLPKITAEDRSLLHYNPNTDDIVEWVQRYASAAITADRAMRAQVAPAAVAGPSEWPTNAMIEAGRKAAESHGPLLGNGQSLWHIFRDMLAAAPQPPVAAVTRDKLPECVIQLQEMWDTLERKAVATARDMRRWSMALSHVERALKAPQPQVAAQEPKRVFLVATGELHEGEETYTRHDDAPPPLCDAECLYPHPPHSLRQQRRGGVLPSLFREALAWGMTYGPEIPAHQWEEMRESMVEKFTARAQAKEGQAMTDTTSAAPSDAEIDAQWRESVEKHETTAAFVRDFARAVLARWGAPQPVARKPMEADVSVVNGINARIHFRRGWRAAEAAHGIGTEKGGAAALDCHHRPPCDECAAYDAQGGK